MIVKNRRSIERILFDIQRGSRCKIKIHIITITNERNKTEDKICPASDIFVVQDAGRPETQVNQWSGDKLIREVCGPPSLLGLCGSCRSWSFL